VRLLIEAGEKDYPEAQYLVGFAYLFGRGVSRDPDKAMRWFQRAAEWGERRAQYNLGVFHASGHVSSRDLVQAHVWFSLAARKGVAETTVPQAALQQLEQAMSPEQVTDARRLREQWKPRKQTRPKEMSDWEWLARAWDPDASTP
jgi:TPR repeat protein